MKRGGTESFEDREGAPLAEAPSLTTDLMTTGRDDARVELEGLGRAGGACHQMTASEMKSLAGSIDRTIASGGRMASISFLNESVEATKSSNAWKCRRVRRELPVQGGRQGRADPVGACPDVAHNRLLLAPVVVFVVDSEERQKIER